MAVINVTNSAELTAALTAARGGDTISLAGGNYGDVSIRDYRPTATVTIKSADLDNPARFETLIIRTSQSLTFQGLDIGRGLRAGEPDYTQLTTVRDSTKIVFDGNFIHGSLDGNPQNDGLGIFVDVGSGLTLTNNTFKELHRGVVITEVNNLYVANNRFFDLRSDGLNVTGSKQVLIEGNQFKGFFPVSYDHPDAIQFHNLGTTEWTENVTIRNNMLLPGGTGNGPQGVWISDPGTTGFRNFTIENNLLWGKGLYNGIGLNGVTGARVAGNTVLSPTDDTKSMWIRLRLSSDIDLINNVSDDVIIESTATNVRQTNNINLRTSPAFRAMMADAENPEHWGDVLLPNVGASVPLAFATEAPISGAVGTALKGLLSPITGQSVAQMLSIVPVSDDELDFSSLSDLVGPSEVAAPMAVAAYQDVETYAPAGGHAWNDVHQDWFVALP